MDGQQCVDNVCRLDTPISQSNFSLPSIANTSQAYTVQTDMLNRYGAIFVLDANLNPTYGSWSGTEMKKVYELCLHLPDHFCNGLTIHKSNPMGFTMGFSRGTTYPDITIATPFGFTKAR